LFMGMMVAGMSLSGLLKNPLTLSGVFTVSGLLFLMGTLLILPLFKLKEDTVVSKQVVHVGEES
jgi:MFS transporter, DHA3 family, macrolide efflux protein